MRNSCFQLSVFSDGDRQSSEDPAVSSRQSSKGKEVNGVEARALKSEQELRGTKAGKKPARDKNVLALSDGLKKHVEDALKMRKEVRFVP